MTENDAGIDYRQVLLVIYMSPDPAEALRAFVEQEREDAVYKARVLSEEKARL